MKHFLIVVTFCCVARSFGQTPPAVPNPPSKVEQNANAPQAKPLWAVIVLDDSFSMNGKLWKIAETVYAEGRGLGLASGANPKDLVSTTAGMDKAGLLIEEFRKKYPPASTAKPDSDSVTYLIYGPIAFGFKPNDKHFTFLRAEVRFFETGFVANAQKSDLSPNK